ncbi:MBL fold metallo-hydrolase [Neptuniibacter sp.]|uniref:MBL fold metallo-hydrolase n=1 Tax=Neptuniibacter sp. TaxID=1962643 RepID=UPI002637112D|nr:MBL fold metallo-hydrolase [Neptuniibacter sp.]MCP4595718.1 MBL fold metallo-hydrolase [Neptuniibacter sp.]
MARFLITCLLLLSSIASAQPLELVTVDKNIYALIGPMEQRSENNLANNANFGFIVTQEGVVLVDSGGTLLGAKAIEQQIKSVTDKPVTLVINTGGQDHRWFGNSFFIKQGAKTLTSIQTQEDQEARRTAQIESTSAYTGSSWQGTQPEIARETIEQITELNIGGVDLVLIPVGAAHTGGETLVWLPKQKILFSGDVVYLDRMLGVGPQSQHLSWLEAFKVIQQLNPEVIIPGHGYPADLEKAEQDTLAYLTFLREEVGKLIEEGQDMSAVSSIDQSRFSYLKVYQEIHGRNAQRVFEEMEWE